MHCSHVRAQRIVNVERRKSKDYSGDKRSRLASGEIKGQKIHPKTGKHKRQEKEKVIAGYAPENDFKIGIDRDYVEFRTLGKLKCSAKKTIVFENIDPFPRNADNLHGVRAETWNRREKMPSNRPSEDDRQHCIEKNNSNFFVFKNFCLHVLISNKMTNI